MPSGPRGTRPLATIAMLTAMVPWPHVRVLGAVDIDQAGVELGLDGGVRNTPNMSWPRGSRISALRSQS